MRCQGLGDTAPQTTRHRQLLAVQPKTEVQGQGQGWLLPRPCSLACKRPFSSLVFASSSLCVLQEYWPLGQAPPQPRCDCVTSVKTPPPNELQHLRCWCQGSRLQPTRQDCRPSPSLGSGWGRAQQTLGLEHPERGSWWLCLVPGAGSGWGWRALDSKLWGAALPEAQRWLPAACHLVSDCVVVPAGRGVRGVGWVWPGHRLCGGVWWHVRLPP